MADVPRRPSALGLGNRLAAVLLTAAVLGACSERTPAQPAPAAPTPVAPAPEKRDDALMAAVFGGQYQASKREAVAVLTEWEDTKAAYRVQPVKHTVLASGETLLLTRARLVRSDDTANSGQNGWLSVYFLRQEQGKWRVLSRHDNAMQLDRNAEFTADWIKPGKGKEGMVVLSSLQSKQECLTKEIALFDFTSAQARQITTESIVAGSNGTEECTFSYPDSRWSIDSKWELVPTKGSGPYHDLLLTFSGEITRSPRDETGQLTGPPATSKVAGKARYVFDDGENVFGLVEGDNPIPQDSDQYG